MSDNTKILRYRVEADSRNAVLEINAFSGAIARIGSITPGQARALRMLNLETLTNAKVTKESALALGIAAKARAELALAEKRGADATLKQAKATEIGEKATRRAADAKQKASKDVIAAFDRELRVIENDTKRQISLQEMAEAEYDKMARAAQKGYATIRKEVAQTFAAEEAAKRKQDRERSVGRGHILDGAKTVGGALTAGVTAPMAALGAYSVSKAIDWETAFAEVKKFAGGSAEELTKLRSELRALALDAKVGFSFTEASNIAAFGAQLGVAREDLSDFVRQVAYIGQAGDLSGEQAATGLAKIISVMRLAPSEFRFAGAALAEMGNQGASKLTEILNVAQRITGAGKQIGLTVPDILAFGNAVISLGQAPESAGTSLSRLFTDMSRAVNQVTEKDARKLQVFAQVAGVSAEQFAQTFREKPMAAILAFETGLGKLPPKSAEVDRALLALGIKSDRYASTVKKLAAGHEDLAKYVESASRAYQNGTAAEEKAAIAAQTTAREIQTLKHEFEDAANNLGEALIPALRDAIRQTKPLQDGIKGLAKEFHDMSPEAQSAWTKVAFVTMIAGPVITGIASIVDALIKLKVAYLAVRAAAGGAGVGATLLRGLGWAGGITAAGAAGWAIGSAVNDTFIGSNDRAGDKANQETAALNAKRGPEYQRFMEIHDRRKSFEGTMKSVQAEVDGYNEKGQSYSPQAKEARQRLANLKDKLYALSAEEAQAKAAAAKALAGGGVKPPPAVKGGKGGKGGTGGGTGGGLSVETEEERAKREAAEKKAETERKKAAEDAAEASAEAANGKLTGLKRQYDTSLSALKEKAASPAVAANLKKTLLHLSDQMLTAAQNLAQAQYDKSVADDPKNTRAAKAKRLNAITAAMNDSAERSSDIAEGMRSAEKRNRAAAHDRAQARRDADIATAQGVIEKVSETLNDTLEGADKKGIDESDAVKFREDAVKLATQVRDQQQEINRLKFQQATSATTDPNVIRGAQAERDTADRKANRAFDDMTRSDAKNPGKIDQTINAARQKRLEGLADEGEAATKEWADGMQSMRAYVENEIRDLEYVRDMTDKEAVTLADVSQKRQIAAALYKRRMEAAAIDLQKVGMQMLNPQMGNADESLQRYLAGVQSATAAYRRDTAQIDSSESSVNVRGAQNRLLGAAVYGKTENERRSAFLASNQGYDAARAKAATAPERDAITSTQARDIADAATRSDSKMDLAAAIQQEETLRANAIAEGNYQLADEIEQMLDRLHEKVKDDWHELARSLGNTIEQAGHRALGIVIDNAGKGGNAIPNALRDQGIDEAKNLLKQLGDQVLKEVEKPFITAGKSAAKSFATQVKGALPDSLKNPFKGFAENAGKQIGQVAGKAFSAIGSKAGIEIGLAAGAAFYLAGGAGKKKQKHSMIGAVLGGIAGSFMGNPLQGAEIGSIIGGQFAAGGTAPGRKVSLFGEQGPELGIPEQDMRIFPAHVTRALMSGNLGALRMGGGSMGYPSGNTYVTLQGPLQHIENVNERTDADWAVNSLADGLQDRLTASGKG